MKCVKKNDQIKRVSDDRALEMTQKEGWTYTSKGAWKSQIRDAKPTPAPIPVPTEAPEVKPAKAKKAKKETK